MAGTIVAHSSTIHEGMEYDIFLIKTVNIMNSHYPTGMDMLVRLPKAVHILFLISRSSSSSTDAPSRLGHLHFILGRANSEFLHEWSSVKLMCEPGPMLGVQMPVVLRDLCNAGSVSRLDLI